MTRAFVSAQNELSVTPSRGAKQWEAESFSTADVPGRYLGNRVGRARKSRVFVAVDTGRNGPPPYTTVGPAAVGERRRRVSPARVRAT